MNATFLLAATIIMKMFNNEAFRMHYHNNIIVWKCCTDQHCSEVLSVVKAWVSLTMSSWFDHSNIFMCCAYPWKQLHMALDVVIVATKC